MTSNVNNLHSSKKEGGGGNKYIVNYSPKPSIVEPTYKSNLQGGYDG